MLQTLTDEQIEQFKQIEHEDLGDVISYEEFRQLVAEAAPFIDIRCASSSGAFPTWAAPGPGYTPSSQCFLFPSCSGCGM